MLNVFVDVCLRLLREDVRFWKQVVSHRGKRSMFSLHSQLSLPLYYMRNLNVRLLPFSPNTLTQHEHTLTYRSCSGCHQSSCSKIAEECTKKKRYPVFCPLISFTSRHSFSITRESSYDRHFALFSSSASLKVARFGCM